MNQLLSTKFFIPKARPELVSRTRLLERLNDGLHRKLTIISAPAGFGKTTLTSEWVTKFERPVAWLSLDKEDGNPTRFLSYLVTAIQTVLADIGKEILVVLQSSQPPPTESILTALLNELASIPSDFCLVLDDYHVLDAKPIDHAITFLLDHLPPQIHLVITTREDPQLPLARLRAQGQLTEIRVSDLRFTLSEAAEFLNQTMGLSLTEDNIAALETRTEGWIAGLQLAAISVTGQDNATEFISAFAGDHRYVVDYLVEEVLQRQSESVRNFLLQTSILQQMNGPLCEAVTGQRESHELLEILERSNLFVISLDNKRYWYRYHHLFGDVLRAYLLDEQPNQVPILHKRASEWYEKNGSLTDAICHAFATEDFNRTAGLVELIWPEMDRNRQSAAWLGWAKALPDELVRERPVLSAGYAWALLDSGELEAAETRIRDAEQRLKQVSHKNGSEGVKSLELPVTNYKEFRHLPATIASVRAYHALALGDVSGTVQYAQMALDALPEKEHFRRGTPAAMLGLALWANGDLETAEKVFSDAMTDYQKAGNILFAITGTFILADIRTALGHLRQAIEVYQQSLQLTEGKDKFVLWGTADLHTGLSELFREQNELDEATQQLSRSKELGEQANLPRWYVRWCIAQARVNEALGDLNGALDLLEEAERNYLRGPVPDVRPISALKTRVLIAQNRLDQALVWAREHGLPADDEIGYLREFEHITLVRLLLAQYKNEQKEKFVHEAMTLLDRLLQAAKDGGRMGSVIEILVLKALAYEAQGDTVAALNPLERALTLAEPEGFVRIFIDEGTPMAHLLSEAADQGIMPNYTGKLLAALEDEKRRGENKSTLPSSQSLIEPLSERELEILQLVAQGLSNREIGERLFLAMPTVKGHNRNIFGKLQVKRRTEAVARGRELGLL